QFRGLREWMYAIIVLQVAIVFFAPLLWPVLFLFAVVYIGIVVKLLSIVKKVEDRERYYFSDFKLI
ncbi:MAG: hypothetical protein ACRC5C_00605, partial [Bacilli bacterium]